MKRLAEKQILEWKDSQRRKPLIVRGARQVGKTWLVENFLAKQFDSFVKIDLEKRRDVHTHFEGNLCTDIKKEVPDIKKIKKDFEKWVNNWMTDISSSHNANLVFDTIIDFFDNS